MLLDSNVIIFAARPENGDLRAFIAQHSPAVSAVSYVEVLGYHKHSESERALFESFFAAANVLPLSDEVLREAIRLRQQRKISLGDSLNCRHGAHSRAEVGDLQHRRLSMDSGADAH